MPRMLNADKMRFPQFSYFVQRTMLKTIPTKKRVWDAFKTYGKMGSFTAYLALSDEDGSPLLRLSPLSGANGEFHNASPQRIFINIDIARRFEHEADNDRAQLTVESTVLHELVHWGDFRADGVHSRQEAGKQFELAAYKKDIDPWWLQPDRSILSDRPSYPKSVDHKPSRGLRNNNPGNIRIVPSKWKGLVSKHEMSLAQIAESQFLRL